MSTKLITSGIDRAYRGMFPIVAVVALGMALVACQGSAPGATNPVAGALPGDPGDPGDEGPPTPRPTPTPNLPPVARLAISPSLMGGPTSVLTYDPVYLDPTASRDPEGKALTLSWDLNGDGTFGDSFGGSQQYCFGGQFDFEPNAPCATPRPDGIPYARPQNGTYKATVRVSDPSGLTDKASVTWTVQNRPPVVAVGASIVRRLDSGAYVVAFEARFQDRDGTLSRVEWRLKDASGATEIVPNRYPSFSREYPSVPVEAVFTAWDDDGAQSSARDDTR
jgi:hypothetical protein